METRETILNNAIHNDITIIENYIHNGNWDNQNYTKFHFYGFVSKSKKISNTKFTYVVFKDCYFRKCEFEGCDFTGAKFIDCNLPSTSFTNCIFDYSQFVNTKIDDSILINCMPSKVNLKMKFARNLRINYETIGDYKLANKAILVEISAEKEHYLFQVFFFC